VKVVVTGGGGFIGRATCVWLKREGHDVAVFDHTYGDDVLGSLHTLDDFEADAIIHLAGVLGTSELFSDVERAIDVNVKGTWRVLEWCLEHDARYVGITMPPVFPSIYTATKLCADRLATAFHLSSDLEVSRVRAFNAFGEGQKFGPDHPQKIIPTFATKAWLGEPIPVWGDGTQTVDLVDAEDVGRMLVDALRFGDDAVFDAGTGYALTVNAVAQLVLDVTGSTAGIEYLPMRAGETPTHIVATGDGWDRLTWSPKYSEDRLAEVIEWYHPSVVRE
jgi:UDP-glucose 4-epimerase